MQLLLDPYARTINGFCILIQKDWSVVKIYVASVHCVEG